MKVSHYLMPEFAVDEAGILLAGAAEHAQVGHHALPALKPVWPHYNIV